MIMAIGVVMFKAEYINFYWCEAKLFMKRHIILL